MLKPNVNRAVWAFALGGGIVALLWWIAHWNISMEVNRYLITLLSPGILIGALAPDSGFDPEGDRHPWGPLSMVLVFTVNALLYSGLIYLVLSRFHRDKSSK